MANGTLTIDTVTDEQFIKLIQIKDKSNGKLVFNPNASVIPSNFTPPGKSASVAGFSSINLNFKDNEGAKFAAEVLQMLSE